MPDLDIDDALGSIVSCFGWYRPLSLMMLTLLDHLLLTQLWILTHRVTSSTIVMLFRYLLYVNSSLTWQSGLTLLLKFRDISILYSAILLLLLVSPSLFYKIKWCYLCKQAFYSTLQLKLSTFGCIVEERICWSRVIWILQHFVG